MIINIVEELIGKGFETVHFFDKEKLEVSYRNIDLEKITNHELLSLLRIDASTAALSGELETLYVTGAPCLPESKEKGFSMMKYEIQKASN